MDNIQLIIEETDLENFKRLDQYLVSKLPEYSRSLIRKFFDDGLFQASIDLEIKKMPPLGTQILFAQPTPKDTGIIPQDIPLDILFEDDHLIIINKQAGLVVHPAPGNYDGTLVNAIMHHCPNIAGIGNEKRPGIVHRLDKGTSGVMVIAKSQLAHAGLIKLFSTHDIERKYEAIVFGARVPNEKTIETLIARSPFQRLKMSTKVKEGKVAITHMRALAFYNHFSHVELKLETGRTHQIRVHLSEILNSPIINDPLYGRLNEEKIYHTSKMKHLLKDYEHPFLHAKTLGFTHPITKEELSFTTKPPEIFTNIIKSFKD